MFPLRPYILLVEDDEDDVSMFKEYFVRRNVEVDIIHYDTGRDALNFLDGTPPENFPKVLLVDRMLPGRPAKDLLASLQTNDSYQTIIKVVWSTYCPTAEKNQLLTLGATYYLDKPATLQEWNELGERISRHFELEATG